MRFAYENADAYLRWKAGTYLDLQGDEADELDDRIDEFHAWHREQCAAEIRHACAGGVAAASGDGLSRQDLDWGYDALRGQARESLRKAAERRRRCSTA